MKAPARIRAVASLTSPRWGWVPWRTRRFWVVQIAIVAIMALHMLTLRTFGDRDLGGVPAPLTSSLMLFPVLYAAVAFGTTGAAATSAWGIVLFALHWTSYGSVTREHVSIEIVGMAVLASSGVVVGRHVDRERESRAGLEQALRRLAVTESRYRDLFDHQPSAVVVTDGGGRVVELNGAAEQLLGTGTLGSSLVEVLGSPPEGLVGRDSLRSVEGQDGRTRRYLISAHRIEATPSEALTQVVLVDVTEQQQRLDFQRALTASVLTAQEAERVRLARELHDDPLQQLTYLARLLEDVPAAAASGTAVAEARRITRSVSTSLRQLIRGLRPPVLDDLGLVPALRQLGSEVQASTGLSVQVRATGRAERAPSDVELAAYRIAQEALANVVKHARATRATVDVELGEQLVLTVTDDGKGFVARRRPRGFGLAGMRERALQARGWLSVDSIPGSGTTVRLALPAAGTRGPDAHAGTGDTG